MAGRVEARLAELGIALPQAAAPVANYVPAVEAAGLLFVSGQLPLEGGRLSLQGRLGAEVDVEAGVRAARLCALNVLAQAKAALGDLDRIARLVEVRGFVACTPEFTDHPKVINGASDLFVGVLGEAGRHARFAVGCPSLPLGAPVEIGAVFAVR
ncbi:hypothetical protein HRbin39_00303 [bacterium HR39]|nr:hypothetical protein HRbin39_00303 [bacterium HR39]